MTTFTVFPMICQDISFHSPLENILYDEVLLDLADRGEGGEVLRFWESPSVFIVMGKTGKDEEDVDAARAQEDGVSVLRRSSGGGTVVQGPGCLNYALVLAKDRDARLNDLRGSYRIILDDVIGALARLGVRAEFRPTSDLVLADNERKFSGNAQRRGRKFILQHGTLLCCFDLALIGRYLKMPREIPEYRRGRSHDDFVANIARETDAVKNALRDVKGLPKAALAPGPRQQQRLNEFLARNRP